ncbi:aspartate aminotransferase family protein [Streptomyces shenzhenensis]|uniref:aspartate aminotransferase family protein n=1 Tax=Streptomyces shenzhenensis TaxID=943815 RepID=UPI0033C659A3
MPHQSELDTYLAQTSTSRALSDRARALLPGGTTRDSTFREPYPIYIASGAGARITDADGRSRLDLIVNYTSLILGHCHPAVMAALTEQIAKSTSFAAPTAAEVELAEEICARVASVEQVRFSNSGTEATMFALRLARAYTGRHKIARVEGGYHGSHEHASVSSKPTGEDDWGSADRPRPVADSRGLDRSVLTSTIVLPFNDLAHCRQILAENAEDVAAVIVEPMLGKSGMIPPAEGFLAGLREITQRHGMLLIFDEIMTLRLAPGGAQQRFGITPDLTTMGKIIGGGLPVAAFGGRADIMDLMNPRNRDGLPQAGTFNGFPLGMVAGLAQMRQLTPAVYDTLNATGDNLRDRLERTFAHYELPVNVTGIGSLLHIHFTPTTPGTYRETLTTDGTVLSEFVTGMLNEGVALAPRGMIALSTPIGEAEVAETIAAVERVLERNAAGWRQRLHSLAAHLDPPAAARTGSADVTA